MSKSPSTIRFSAKLLVPAGEPGPWCFLVLPKRASKQLPSRGTVSVKGTINDFSFRASLEPDGNASHWLKVTKRMRQNADAEVGDVVDLQIQPDEQVLEPRVPADLREALATAPKARALWSEITPVARRDWIQWIISAKRPETRARRIKNACEMLSEGKRRVCCFDRSGIYGKNFRAPSVGE